MWVAARLDFGHTIQNQEGGPAALPIPMLSGTVCLGHVQKYLTLRSLNGARSLIQAVCVISPHQVIQLDKAIALGRMKRQERSISTSLWASNRDGRIAKHFAINVREKAAHGRERGRRNLHAISIGGEIVTYGTTPLATPSAYKQHWTSSILHFQICQRRATWLHHHVTLTSRSTRCLVVPPSPEAQRVWPALWLRMWSYLCWCFGMSGFQSMQSMHVIAVWKPACTDS